MCALVAAALRDTMERASCLSDELACSDLESSDVIYRPSRATTQTVSLAQINFELRIIERIEEQKVIQHTDT